MSKCENLVSARIASSKQVVVTASHLEESRAANSVSPPNGGVKVTEARRHAARRPSRSGDLCREGAPLGQGSRASLLVDLPRDEMALLIELVVHLGVN